MVGWLNPRLATFIYLRTRETGSTENLWPMESIVSPIHSSRKVLFSITTYFIPFFIYLFITPVTKAAVIRGLNGFPKRPIHCDSSQRIIESKPPCSQSRGTLARVALHFTQSRSPRQSVCNITNCPHDPQSPQTHGNPLSSSRFLDRHRTIKPSFRTRSNSRLPETRRVLTIWSGASKPLYHVMVSTANSSSNQASEFVGFSSLA
jgi:hypothetical protein